MVQTIGRCHVPPSEKKLKYSLFEGNMTKVLRYFNLFRYKEKVQNLREQRYNDEVKACTFIPKTNSIKSKGTRSKLSNKARLNSNYSQSPIKFEDEVNDFISRNSDSNDSKETLKYSNAAKKNSDFAHDFSSVVKSENYRRNSSYKENNQEEDPKNTNQQSEPDSNHENSHTFGKQKNGENQLFQSSRNDEKPEDHDDSKIKFNTEVIETAQNTETPILFLDVNFGKGNVTRIVMYENDTPEELAEAFCAEHKLNDEKKSKLISIIKAHFDKVLERIIEQPYDEE